MCLFKPVPPGTSGHPGLIQDQKRAYSNLRPVTFGKPVMLSLAECKFLRQHVVATVQSEHLIYGSVFDEENTNMK
jgi:hypothetical protein